MLAVFTLTWPAGSGLAQLAIDLEPLGTVAPSTSRDSPRLVGFRWAHGRQDYLYNIHYNVFDFATLKRELEAAGFADVRSYDWRETEHAEIDDYSQAYLPHMDKERGLLISLNVECTKPSDS